MMINDPISSVSILVLRHEQQFYTIIESREYESANNMGIQVCLHEIKN